MSFLRKSNGCRIVFISIIALGFLFAIFARTYAQDSTVDPSKLSWKELVLLNLPMGIGSIAGGFSMMSSNTPCSLESFFGAGFGNCVAYMWAKILSFLLKIFSYFLWVVGKIFNIVVYINNTAFYNQPLVNVGWKITRDVVNIFYIFILLAISIATILGISSYGMKDLLWKLIISALFVNFSLPLTGFVIDASNVLGAQFYKSAATDEDTELKNIDKSEGKKLDLSAAIIAGFEPEDIYKTAQTSDGVIEASANLADRLLNISIAYLAGILLILTAIFTLLAAAVLLIIRIVVLWIVMILSPLAFAAWVLPGTRGMIWNKWADTLFKQSFFYPAYMFMLYLSIRAINSGVIAKLVGADKDSLPQMFTGASTADGIANFATSLLAQKVNLILSFFMLGAFMVAGLIVAKQMGAYGSSAAQKFAGGTMRMVGGAIGRPIGRAGSRIGKRYASQLASEAETGTQRKWYSPTGLALRAAGRAQKIPVIGGTVREGLQKASTLNKNDIAEQQKNMKSRTDDQLKRLAEDPRTHKERALAATSELIDRKKLSRLDKKTAGDRINDLKRAGMIKEATSGERQRLDIVAANLQAKLESPKEEEKLDAQKQLDDVTKHLSSTDDFKALDESLANDPHVRASILRTASQRALQSIAENGGKMFDKIREDMTADSRDTAEKVADWLLSNKRNANASTFMRGSVGAVQYGIPREADQAKKEGEDKKAGSEEAKKEEVPPRPKHRPGFNSETPEEYEKTEAAIKEWDNKYPGIDKGGTTSTPTTPPVEAVSGGKTSTSPSTPSATAKISISQMLDEAESRAAHEHATTGTAPRIEVNMQAPRADQQSPPGAGTEDFLRRTAIGVEGIKRATEGLANDDGSGVVMPQAPEPPKDLNKK